MKTGFRAFIPLLFMVLGLVSLFWCQREFHRRAERDNAELRQDLKESGVSQPQIAALLSAHTKLQANASAYTQLATFIVFVVAIFSLIPLYSRTGREAPADEGHAARG